MGQRVVHIQVADLGELLIPHSILLGKQEAEELTEEKDFKTSNNRTNVLAPVKHSGFCSMFKAFRRRAEYLADGEHRIVGFSHGVVDKGGHQFSDLVQITGPGLLRNKGT